MKKSKVCCQYINECMHEDKKDCANCVHNEALEEKDYFETIQD